MKLHLEVPTRAPWTPFRGVGSFAGAESKPRPYYALRADVTIDDNGTTVLWRASRTPGAPAVSQPVRSDDPALETERTRATAIAKAAWAAATQQEA